MIKVYLNAELIYTGEWQNAPEVIKTYCQHLVDAGNDVTEYFSYRTPTVLAMKGYEVTPA